MSVSKNTKIVSHEVRTGNLNIYILFYYKEPYIYIHNVQGNQINKSIKQNGSVGLLSKAIVLIYHNNMGANVLGF